MNDQDVNNELSIEDLSIQHTEEIKGGAGITKLGSHRLIIQSGSAYGQQEDETASLNHNETVSEDGEDDTQKLEDLSVENEIESDIKGGAPVKAGYDLAQNKKV